MRKLEVRLDWGDEEILVGTLAEQERSLYFEYDSAFIAKPLSHKNDYRTLPIYVDYSITEMTDRKQSS